MKIVRRTENASETNAQVESIVAPPCARIAAIDHSMHASSRNQAAQKKWKRYTHRKNGETGSTTTYGVPDAAGDKNSVSALHRMTLNRPYRRSSIALWSAAAMLVIATRDKQIIDVRKHNTSAPHCPVFNTAGIARATTTKPRTTPAHRRPTCTRTCSPGRSNDAIPVSVHVGQLQPRANRVLQQQSRALRLPAADPPVRAHTAQTAQMT